MGNMIVNGKPLSQVLSELKAFTAEKRPRANGGNSFDYYPIEAYFQAFDTVVGTENYTVDYSELKYMKISSGQEMVTAKCTITLIGDDGLPVIHKEGYGGTEIKYNKTSHIDSGIANAPHTATTSAFKGAAKWFGVLCDYAEAAMPEGSPAKESKGKAAKEQKPTAKMSFHTKGGFYQESTDKNSGKEIWKIGATLDSDQSACELIFYPNQYGKDERKFGRLMDAANQKSQLLRLIVIPCGEREGKAQFIFTDYMAA